MAWRAALTARPSPDPVPIPMIAEPALLMTIFTSAKSVLMRPGTLMRSVMPCTPWSRTSSAIENASTTEVLLVRDREQALVRDDDERVDLLLAGAGSPASACIDRRRPSKANGRVTTPIVERAEALGALRDHRCCARTRAAALARRDEYHVGALQHLLDLLEMLLGRQPAHLGVAPGAEPTGQRAADVELDVRFAHQQSLRVRVHRHELDALQTRVDHPVDGVDAGATDADYFDHGDEALPWGTHARSILS